MAHAIVFAFHSSYKVNNLYHLVLYKPILGFKKWPKFDKLHLCEKNKYA